MKKLILIISALFLLTTNIIYAEPSYEYSDWSTIQTNYPGEQEKIEYGYQYPIEWSSWSVNNPYDPYTISSYQPWPTSIPGYASTWYSTNRQTLYSWPQSGEFSEPKKLLKWYIDIDAYSTSDYAIETYYEPKMELVCKLPSGSDIVVGTTPGRGGSEYNMSINMSGSGNYNCKKVSLKVVEDVPRYGSYKKINMMSTVYSYVSFEELCYSYVTRWSDGMGWRDDVPYTNVYGANPIKAVTRKVYRHPLYYFINYYLDDGHFIGDYPIIYYPEVNTVLKEPEKLGYEFIGFHINPDLTDSIISIIYSGTRGDLDLYAEYKRKAPILEIDKKYLYEDDDIEDIRRLPKATDELDGDISSKIVITNIKYDDTGESYNYPSSFDPFISDTIHVSYEVENNDGVKTNKTVILYILRDGKFIDLKIYDRYIKEEYLDTLESNSIWKSPDYSLALKKALNWIGGK